ncbi:MAG: hypothetical protein ACK5FV_05175 [Bacteroidota bacterium]|jgi:hypothetical protein|nr:hypothetical protein [Saprospiraceae bacterium]
MAKKKFSEGLDDLLSDSKEGGIEFADSATAAARPKERRQGHKSFMSGLDSLLQEALDESLSHQDNMQAASASSQARSASKRSASDSVPHGLDALIRQTIDIQDIMTDEATGKRRLTVAVDKTKLEKLKTIARLENSYLKDLLVELIDAYIHDYPVKKGVDI